LVERLVYTEDVGGSSPSSPTIFHKFTNDFNSLEHQVLFWIASNEFWASLIEEKSINVAQRRNSAALKRAEAMRQCGLSRWRRLMRLAVFGFTFESPSFAGAFADQFDLNCPNPGRRQGGEPG
jgi:hypothetical protein